MSLKSWQDALEELDDMHITTHEDVRRAMLAEIDALQARVVELTDELQTDQLAMHKAQARVAELEQGRVYWVESAVKEEERAERAEADLAAARAECAALQALRTMDLAALVTLGQERDTLREQLAAAQALLPGVYYMDPPDGGSVEMIVQLRRMADDAARYRWLKTCLWWRTDPFAQDVGNIGTGYWQTKLFKQIVGKPDLDAAIDAALKDAK